MERTHEKRKTIKHGQFVDSVPKSHPFGYESRKYPGDLTVSVELKRNSGISLALQDNDSKPRTSFLIALFDTNLYQKHTKESFFHR